MVKKWNSGLLRDDSKLTPFLKIPPVYGEYRLTIFRNINIPLSVLPEETAPLDIESCTLHKGERYHECEVHAIFLIWVEQ